MENIKINNPAHLKTLSVGKRIYLSVENVKGSFVEVTYVSIRDYMKLNPYVSIVAMVGNKYSLMLTIGCSYD